MDRLAGIARCQWRAYWRLYSRKLTAGHQGIALIITVVALLKYMRLLGSASAHVAQGNTALAQSLLAAVCLAWMFLPLSNSGISFRGLLHLPLSLRDLFALRVVSFLITPYAWLLVAGSLAMSYPLAHAPRPWTAMLAALLFIAMSCSTGLLIAHLLGVAAWRRLWFAVLVLAGMWSVYVLSIDAVRFRHLLLGSPTELVARAAAGKNPLPAIGWLLLANVLALAAAWWTFPLSLARAHQPDSHRRMDSILFRLPGMAAGLAAKDFRYFRRLLDPYFGLLASAVCCFYLVSAKTPTATVVWIIIVIVFIPNASLAFNLFGLDRQTGLDRYALLPLSGAKILRSKAHAFVIVSSVQVFPILLLASWRVGLSVGVFGLLEAASLAFAYLAWGNWMSIAFPAKMQFFRFAPVSGSIPEIIAGLVAGSLPGALTVYFQSTRPGQAIWLTLLTLLVSGTLYLLTTIRFGRRFEQQRERMLRAIS